MYAVFENVSNDIKLCQKNISENVNTILERDYLPLKKSSCLIIHLENIEEICKLYILLC